MNNKTCLMPKAGVLLDDLCEGVLCARLCVCVCVCVCVCMSVCVCVCACVSACMFVHVRVCMCYCCWIDGMECIGLILHDPV